jgi:hypothetical protein
MVAPLRLTRTKLLEPLVSVKGLLFPIPVVIVTVDRLYVPLAELRPALMDILTPPEPSFAAAVPMFA